jgi:uncharacterized protein (TIGR02284 family)
MEARQDKAVKALNSLIETTLDSAHGYEEAAENTSSEELRTLFAERSRRRMDLARQLQQEVRSFGGEPEDSQSLLGKAHNKFVELKKSVTGGDSDKAVVDEVERGEDVIKAKFRKALDDELPTTARQTVSRAYESIRADHDEISQLKRSMH